MLGVVGFLLEEQSMRLTIFNRTVPSGLHAAPMLFFIRETGGFLGLPAGGS